MSVNSIELNHWELPNGYNENKIMVMVKDPYWIFTYWEISSQTRDNVEAFLMQSDQKFEIALKVSELSSNKQYSNSFYVTVADSLSNWYINVNKPNKLFIVEIGYRISDEYFISLAQSNTVYTPRDRASGNNYIRYININEHKTKDMFTGDKFPHIYSNGSEAYFGVSSSELFQ